MWPSPWEASPFEQDGAWHFSTILVQKCPVKEEKTGLRFTVNQVFPWSNLSDMLKTYFSDKFNLLLYPFPIPPFPAFHLFKCLMLISTLLQSSCGAIQQLQVQLGWLTGLHSTGLFMNEMGGVATCTHEPCLCWSDSHFLPRPACMACFHWIQIARNPRGHLGQRIKKKINGGF